jgi:hypothetical protein
VDLVLLVRSVAWLDHGKSVEIKTLNMSFVYSRINWRHVPLTRTDRILSGATIQGQIQAGVELEVGTEGTS